MMITLKNRHYHFFVRPKNQFGEDTGFARRCGVQAKQRPLSNVSGWNGGHDQNRIQVAHRSVHMHSNHGRAFVMERHVELIDTFAEQARFTSKVRFGRMIRMGGESFRRVRVLQDLVQTIQRFERSFQIEQQRMQHVEMHQVRTVFRNFLFLIGQSKRLIRRSSGQ